MDCFSRLRFQKPVYYPEIRSFKSSFIEMHGVQNNGRFSELRQNTD